MDKKCHHLIIDKEFKALSPLYSKDILSKAETDILLSGSLSSPIKVWGNTILTDFLSYQICHKLNIPFEIERITFYSRSDALLYTCRTFIETENLSEPHNRYLIGKAYFYMCALMADVYHGRRPNPFSKEHTQILKNKYARNKTAFIAASLFHVSPTTVTKYASFANAIDEIRKKNMVVSDAILEQSFRISMENTIALAKLPTARITWAYKEGITKLPENFFEAHLQLPPKADPQIKQMPAYDKDAELSSPTLTINAWNTSMERFLRISKLSLASDEAKEKLNQALIKLSNTATLIQFKIKESDHES